jgi:hypothetical protein
MADLLGDAQFLEQYQQAVAAANQASSIEPSAVVAYYSKIHNYESTTTLAR